MATASKSIPFAVPTQQPQKVEVISQTEIAMLISLRGRLHQLTAQAEAAEQSIRDRLTRGASVEDGDHVAELKEQFRGSIAWKDKAIELAERLRLNGSAWARNVLAHTTKTRTVSLLIE